MKNVIKRIASAIVALAEFVMVIISTYATYVEIVKKDNTKVVFLYMIAIAIIILIDKIRTELFE